MKSSLIFVVFLAILSGLTAERCNVTVRTPYIKSTSSKIIRETTCHYKCVRRHQTEVRTDYWAVDSCVVDYKTSLASDCCEEYENAGQRGCIPICQGCNNGHCTAPNECTCNEGYRSQLGICVPVCDPECGRGTCEAPGQCSCDEGYEMGPRKGCIPSCDPPCQNGTCIDRNTCQCFDGYQNTTESNVCIPMCDPMVADCAKGSCVAPNRCSCEEGFIFESSRCIPQCDPSCINGECFEPNSCTCKEGFINDATNSNICVPVCNSTCHNGTCIAPNTCQCLPGYRQSHTNPNSCEPSCDPKYVDDRNGQCIAFNVLQCNEGFDLEYSSLSGLIHCSKVIK